MTIIDHVHATQQTVETIELTPPHAPRVETEAYKRAHEFLVLEQDTPCFVCGVRHSTLNSDQNIYKATAIETHHFPIERSLVDACDPNKVHSHFPEVIDRATLELFVDSPRNLLVLCDVHHRSLAYGIHHLLAQDFSVLPYLYDHYTVVATAATEAAAIQQDEAIVAEVSHGN